MKKLIPFVLICALFLCGCAQHIELTDEESMIIAEYAASSLLRYDVNYQEKLITPTPLLPTATPTVTPSPTATPTPEASSGNPEVTGGAGGTGDTTAKLSDVIGIENIELEYVTYEVGEYFLDDGASFSLEPQEAGNYVMVIRLNVVNTSSEDMKVDLSGFDIYYQLNVNLSDNYISNHSVLQNDIMNFNETISAGYSKEALLVFDVPSDIVPDKMNLFIMKGSKTVIIKLK